MPKPVTAALIRSKKPVTRVVELFEDPDLGRRWRAAQGELELSETLFKANASDLNRDRLDKAEEAKAQLKPEVEENAFQFTFKGIGREPFNKLQAAHPATEKNRADAKRRGVNREEVQWNSDTFPPALVWAALVQGEEGDITEEDIQVMWNDDNWNEGELSALFAAALSVNLENSVAELGKG